MKEEMNDETVTPEIVVLAVLVVDPLIALMVQ